MIANVVVCGDVHENFSIANNPYLLSSSIFLISLHLVFIFAIMGSLASRESAVTAPGCLCRIHGAGKALL